MKLVLEIRRHPDDERTAHHVIEKFPAKIGRGYHNDIILQDPHVGADHLMIDYDGEHCRVSDLDSVNGVYINAHLKKGERVSVHSGDVLRLGHTEIRIFSADHPLPPAVALQPPKPFYKLLAKSPLVWGSFALAVALGVGWAWFNVWTEEPGMMLASAGAGTAGVIILWSTIWSVAGRLIRHKPNFKSHVSLICLYTILGTLAWYVEAYVDFLSNENWLSRAVTCALNFGLMALLLYGSLTLATRMTERRRIFSSVFFSAGVVAGAVILSWISAKNFNQQPIYPETLEPYLARLAPAQTVDQFMAGNAKLFLSKKL